MPTPKQVLKKEKEADDLIKKMIEEPGENTDLTEEPVESDLTDENQDLEPGVEEPIIEPLPVETPNLEDDLKKEKHRYKVLQGMFDKRIRPLEGEISALRQQNLDLTSIIAKRTEEVESKPKPIDFTKTLTRDQIDALETQGYSPDAINAMGESIMGVSKQHIDSIGKDVSELRKDIATTRDQRFWSDLKRDVPEWEVTNDEPEFHEFLGESIPYVGMTRKQVLDQARNNLDSVTVANIFNDFKQTKTPNQSTSTVTTEGVKKVTPHVAPPLGPSGSLPSDTAKGKIWKLAEIKQFYTDVALKKYDMKPKEKERIERDIWNAQFQEGRITR